MMADEHTNWTYTELYHLPIVLRNFFVSEMEKRLERREKAYEKAKNKNNR
jgi:hypothetical protein